MASVNDLSRNNEKYLEFVAYWQTIAENLDAIGHTAEERHFTQYAFHEIMEDKLNDLRSPFLGLEDPSVRHDNNDNESIHWIWSSAIVIASEVERGNITAAKQAKQDALILLQKILGKLKKDRELLLIPWFDFTTVRINVVNEVFRNCVGYRMSFEFPSQFDLGFYEDDWTNEPNAEPTVPFATVNDSGDIIELEQGGSHTCSTPGDATWVLKDTDGNQLDTGAIAPSGSEDIEAPDGSVTVNNDAFGNVKSNGALNVPVIYETQGPVPTVIDGTDVVVPDVPPAGGYALPEGYLEFEEFSGEEIRLRIAVFNAPFNAIALKCSVDVGNVVYDWGDGNSDTVASGVVAEHVYDWDDVGSGTLCSRGFRQAWLIITPETGSFNSYVIDINQVHSGVTSRYSRIITGMAISAPSGSSKPVIAASNNHLLLEEFYYYGSNSLSNAVGMFTSSYTQKVGAFDLSAMNNVTQVYRAMKALVELPSLIDISSSTASDGFLGAIESDYLYVHLTNYGQDATLSLFSQGTITGVIELEVDDNESSHITSLNSFAFNTRLATAPSFSDTSNITDWRNSFNYLQDGVIPAWDMSAATLTSGMLPDQTIQKFLATGFTCDMDFSNQLLTTEEQDRIADNAGTVPSGTSNMLLNGNPGSTSAYAQALLASKNYIVTPTP